MTFRHIKLSIAAVLLLTSAAAMTSCTQGRKASKAKENTAVEGKKIENGSANQPMRTGPAQVRHSPGGLEYIVWPPLDKMLRPQAEIDGSVKVHFTLSDEKGTVLNDSRRFGEAVEIPISAPAYAGDPMEVFGLMREKDSVQIKLNADTFFSANGGSLPQGVEPHTYVFLRVKVYEVKTAEMLREQQKALEAGKANQKNTDDSLIADYLKKNKIQAEKMPSGLYIQKIKNCDGPKPAAGKKVKVHYTGTLLNGHKFDSSRDRGTPLEFKLGVGQVIRGWDEGIAQLPAGCKAKLFIPSHLAYGEQQAGSEIPPNSVLVFDIEMVSFE